MTAIEQLREPTTAIPAAPEASPSCLHLTFTLDQGATRMRALRQDPPWRAIRSFPNAQRQALVHLHNVSGGIFSGDALHLSLHAAASTRAQVTSVGATRIYRHRPERAAARLTTSIRVDDDATLEYLPDPVIPFSGSCCHQSLTVTLGRNAGFIGWETLAAGRISSGEQFRFDTFASEYVIQSADRPLAWERYRLVPSQQNLRSPSRWGKFNYTTTLYICHTGVTRSVWLHLESRMNQLAFDTTSEASRWGVSTLIAGGLAIRGLALEAHQITSQLHAFWDFAKIELWGESALPPRKIN